MPHPLPSVSDYALQSARIPLDFSFLETRPASKRSICFVESPVLASSIVWKSRRTESPQKSMSKKKTCSVEFKFRSGTILKVPKSLQIVQVSSLRLPRLSTAVRCRTVQTISSPFNRGQALRPTWAYSLSGWSLHLPLTRLGTGLSTWEFPRFHLICCHPLLDGDASINVNIDRIYCGDLSTSFDFISDRVAWTSIGR